MPFDAAPSLPNATACPLTPLALAAQRGDGKALNELLRALPPRLTHLVLRELRVQGRSLPAHEIDDVVEDLLVSAWRYDLARFDATRGTFVAFLKKRVSWRVGDAVRVHGRSRTTELSDEQVAGARLVAPDAGPQERLDASRRELKLLVFPGAVRTALSQLDDASAARAVTAYDLEGCELREVAAELGVHTSNACRARQRGLRWLREHLPEELREAA